MRIGEKKSQEEMVGFVLIIVLVAVIALVFLAISVRPRQVQENKDVENFLHVSLLYTTECQPRAGEVYDLRDLIAACYKNEECLSGEPCEILNRTVSELVERSFNLESKYKAYKLEISKENETIFSIAIGNSTSNKIGSAVAIPVSGESIELTLRLFY